MKNASRNQGGPYKKTGTRSARGWTRTESNMQATSITRTLALAGFVPAGKPANHQERLCSTRNSAINSVKRACAVFVLCAATAIAQPAPTLTTLFSFNSTDGAGPNAMLVQGTDGNLYGTTYEGGANGLGTVFKIDPSGTLMTLYNFCPQSGCTDGEYPEGALVEDTNGDFYGTSEFGGTNGLGTVFKITPRGTLTTLYNFCSQSGCTDGETPLAGLVRAAGGDFYGTTCCGGANGLGTVFKISPSGTLTTLYNFCAQSGCTDGLEPFAGLIQAINGDFYGTTLGGGASGEGTIFKMTPSGTLTTLFSFNGTDGAQPTAALVQAADGDFYGTTAYDGTDVHGGAYSGGTIFKITPSGTLTTLYNFCSQIGCADGYYPVAGLIQATDGRLYGTTSQGGAGAGGTVFRITPNGTLATIYSFCSQRRCADGASPYVGLVQATNGTFYGTTFFGGTNGGAGTIFSLSVGLGPFGETQTTSGAVGAAVNILGTDLSGASSGKVEVVTPSGTLASNVPFRVLP
jgi:uncharacterized repeat protein (TIGR03803 family)